MIQKKFLIDGDILIIRGCVYLIPWGWATKKSLRDVNVLLVNGMGRSSRVVASRLVREAMQRYFGKDLVIGGGTDWGLTWWHFRPSNDQKQRKSELEMRFTIQLEFPRITIGNILRWGKMDRRRSLWKVVGKWNQWPTGIVWLWPTSNSHEQDASWVHVIALCPHLRCRNLVPVVDLDSYLKVQT